MSFSTTKLNLKVVVFCDFVDPLFWFFCSQNGAVFRPPKGGHFTSPAGFLYRGAERRGRKMDPFLGGLGLQNESLPGTIRSTFGSRFQLPFWVPLCADQRFSGCSACCRTMGCLTTILHLPCLLTIRRGEAPRMFGFGLQSNRWFCLTWFDNRTTMPPPPVALWGRVTPTYWAGVGSHA